MSTATEDVSANGVADENDDNFSQSVDEVIRLLDELAPGTDDDGGAETPPSDPQVGREEGTLSGEIVETAPPELDARPPNSYCGEGTTVDCCQHREEAESLKKQVEDAKTREDQMAAALKDVRAENEELKEAVEVLKDENKRINRMLSTSGMQRPEAITVYSMMPETQPATYQQTEKKVVASDPDEGGDTPGPGHTGDQQPARQLFKPAPQPPHAFPQPPPQPYQPAPQPPPQTYQLAPQPPPQPYQLAPQTPPQPYQLAPQTPPQPYQLAPQTPPQVYPPQLYPPTTLQYQSAPQVVPAFGTQQPAAQFHYPSAGQLHNNPTFNITFTNAPAQTPAAGAHLGHPVAEAQRDPVTIHQPPPEESLHFPIQVQDTRKQSDCSVTFKKTIIDTD
ncbi:PREDICTED: leucine-rich repeat extensin-like protein 2 [Branchiostoma belcheri]|uniref:Leucine-rich repeat extensin-like protein 2 n=1 Tax=Branchiostoma belcheri TaxID=7741 RepID=A0A6P4YX97_BRABE|nr:PREDICTED: leucine-rich repeat extensin-like protein 2 [Branchiostoma belcheri]